MCTATQKLVFGGFMCFFPLNNLRQDLQYNYNYLLSETTKHLRSLESSQGVYMAKTQWLHNPRLFITRDHLVLGTM